MPSKKREVGETLRPVIKTLIIREARRLEFKQSFTPRMILDEMSRSLQEAKRQVAALVRFMSQEDRNALIRRMIRQSLEEEIDRIIERRQNRCFRCIHLRFYDESGTGHVDLPLGNDPIRNIGCELTQRTRGKPCRRFSERVMAMPLYTYLSEVTILYELRERFDAISEIWEDYLTR